MPQFFEQVPTPTMAAKPRDQPMLVNKGDATTTPTATIAALLLRQKEAQARAQGVQQMNMGTIPQGLAGLAQAAFAGFDQYQAQKQEQEGRAALAQIMGEISPDTGATPEQLARISSYDPELGEQYRKGAYDARQAELQQQAAIANREDEQTFTAGENELNRQAAAAKADNWRTLTPDEVKAGGLDPNKTYQQDKTSGKISPIGAEGTTVNVGAGETESQKKAGAAVVDYYDQWAKEGRASVGASQKLSALKGQLANFQPGTAAGVKAWIMDNFGVEVGEDADAVQTARALINSLAPGMRVEGSGSMSNFDVQLLLDSLPRIMGTPEGNARIVDYMQRMADFKQKAGAIANRALRETMKGGPEAATAFDRADAEIAALPDPFADLREERKATAGSTAAPVEVEDSVEGKASFDKLAPGTKYRLPGMKPGEYAVKKGAQ